MNLQVFCASSNKLLSLKGLEKCARLQECIVDGNQLSVIEPLYGLEHLHVVDVSRNPCLESLKPLYDKHIEDLWMSKNPKLDVLRELMSFDHKTDLKTLAVDGCTAPSPQALLSILKAKFANLRTLNGDLI